MFDFSLQGKENLPEQFCSLFKQIWFIENPTTQEVLYDEIIDQEIDEQLFLKKNSVESTIKYLQVFNILCIHYPH